MAQRVIIVGAGGIGRALANQIQGEHEVLVVDSDPVACRSVGDPASPTEVRFDGEPGLQVVCGDATSRLVLAALARDSKATALVTTTGRDEVNVEVGRIGRELGFEPVLSVLRDAMVGDRYVAERIVTIDRYTLVADHFQRSLRHAGAVVPVGIGLGQEELVEVRLLRTSPILGRPLRDLAPKRWRVAAVFRGDSLVIPSGETQLQVDDRVLLVGDPKEMRDVAEYIRMGRPQFPHPFGPNVVTLEMAGPDEALFAEASSLAGTCCVERLLRGLPSAVAPRFDEPVGETEPSTEETSREPIRTGTFKLPDPQDPRFAERLARRRPGVIALRPPRPDRWATFLGRRPFDGRLCDGVTSPVLFARGGAPYRHILLPVSDSEMNLPGAELAIDLTRQHGATLSALNVDLPRFLTGLGEEAWHVEIEPIRRLCDLYGVSLDYHHQLGNPIRHVLAESSNHDLIVMTRRRGRPDTWMDPDIALRVARRASCSVLVLTVAPPT